ncbi:fungal-specific transcription factor domain-containing protein [Desarmillaria tabescens]|uniref:Fungal-specific transcription factor domain-containing protein n=1 Tax=Armillaria tabescens TaxID=1929756 RepID=A0AA39JFM6_ARMTA|nr:fungal-specific transcription factor domain-containing protein [Desarmillaria tabescens]KAK0441743.1 fungal-specific transcription factor domain-containing protein [Desarmillaria tabescens]
MTDDDGTQAIPSKKRRLAGACDRCRRKKSDSATAPGNRCSNCVAFEANCSHTDLIKKRGPKPIHAQEPFPIASYTERQDSDTSHVQTLERRVKMLETMLKELNPDAILPEGGVVREISPDYMPIYSQSSTSRQPSESSEVAEPEEDFSHPDLLENMKNLSLHHGNHFGQRYFGPSSSFSLLTSALSIKKKFTGSDNMIQLRDHFNLQPWERATADAETPHYVYPDNDLIQSLVAIFFETINPIIPILHRPTFQKHVEEGLHLRDYNFGAALLLVLAVASRYSDDPRVLASPSSRLSSGWRFFEQVRIFKNAIYTPASLYELQFAALGAIYAIGTSIPQFSWTMIGIGLRSAIEIGLHRRKPEGHKLTVDDELKKRSFWALVVFDRLTSLYIGRPTLVQEEDFDLEPPIECDDEYWEIAPDGQVHFNQPTDKPSIISYFNASIKLSEIMSFAVRTLYSIKKGRDVLGLTGEGWEQRLVADIDSSMNAWADSIPDHLRWDPKRENGIFLYQSAALYSIYYMAQILIHRPFLHTDSPLSIPSLAICTSAARSCTRILEVHMTRMKTVTPHIIMGTFTSGAVFAMNIWSSRQAGHAPNAKDLAGFELCLATFEDAADTNIFKAIASVENAKVSTVPPTHRQEMATLSPTAPPRSPYDTVPRTTILQGVQPFVEQTYSDGYTATQLGTGIPLGWTNGAYPAFQSSPQLPFLNMDSGLSAGLGNSAINMWNDALLGFGFSEWDAYVSNMTPGTNGQP